MKTSIFTILLSVLLLSACNPSKVTDPRDPKFDPSAVSFDDYLSNSQDMIMFLKIVFPPGTSKEYVDQILVDSAGAKVRHSIPINSIGKDVEQVILNHSESNNKPTLSVYPATRSRPPILSLGIGSSQNIYVIFNNSSEVIDIYYKNTFVHQMKR